MAKSSTLATRDTSSQGTPGRTETSGQALRRSPRRDVPSAPNLAGVPEPRRAARRHLPAPLALPPLRVVGLAARPRFKGLNWVIRTGSRSGNRAMISSSPPTAAM